MTFIMFAVRNKQSGNKSGVIDSHSNELIEEYECKHALSQWLKQ